MRCLVAESAQPHLFTWVLHRRTSPDHRQTHLCLILLCSANRFRFPCLLRARSISPSICEAVRLQLATRLAKVASCTVPAATAGKRLSGHTITHASKSTMIRTLLLPLALTCGVLGAQPSAPSPIAAPLRELPWAQLNFLHTTDIHGWCVLDRT